MTTPITATDQAQQPVRHEGRRPGLAVALILTFLGVLIVLAIVFQPFASAAGGCGGG